ncbi:S-adenosyl-l-methionine hydroxide adenosyltransferase family protein [Aquifex pyrophilus]
MVIALLTDFGTKDGFVGAVKGVILSINPSVQIVDITHEVNSFDILEGALILKAHYSYFPEGSIFVCVVDPGVGSERRGIVVKTKKYIFVGPDNGIFDLVLREEKEFETYLIENERFTLPRRNNTFHGRDVFAPVSAYLSRGVRPELIGRKIEYTFRLDIPGVKEEEDYVEGVILYFDKFGNGITNVPCGKYREGEFRGDRFKVVNFFLEGERDKLNGVCGSFGLMELFVPLGSARERFGLKKGEKVRFFK